MEQGLHPKLSIKREVNVIPHAIKKDFKINLRKVMHIQKNHLKKQYRPCTRYKELKKYNHKKK
jgi:hypothetical protein